MKRLSLLVVFAACGAVDQPNTPDASALDPIVGGGLVGGPSPTPACAADPAACLYLPDTSATLESVMLDFLDPDRIGGPRRIPVMLRWSPTAPRPMPVVVWSHGGAQGHFDPTSSLAHWATIAAHAGYLSIAIAHVPRDAGERAALCSTYGLGPVACDTFKYLSYDRPIDISRVIDEIVELAEDPAWIDRIDTTRIGVGGHSAGAGGALMVAGASRDINGTPVVLQDLRPLAFVATSPQAPGVDGMTETGYALVERPTLIATGRGDDDLPEQTADGRASVFEYLQPGDKARIFVEDVNAVHGLFALDTDGCVASGDTLDNCLAMRDWVASAGLAFLDAHLRDSAPARAFLDSSNLDVASAGLAEWSTR